MRLCCVNLLILTTLFSGSYCTADDYAAIQGVWERSFINNDRQYHVKKTIHANQEIVEVFHQGLIVQKHIVKFELTTEGPVKVFRWKKGQITEGPNAGKPLPDGQMIYRLEGNVWVSVQGLLIDDRGAPLTEVYRKTGESPVEQPG